jgi:hypothetical protein
MPRWARSRTPVTGLAPAALLPPAAFAVHQLRFWLAFGPRAGFELQRQGHSYLHSLAPWIMLLVALAAGVFLRALGRALGGQCSVTRYSVSFAGLWLLCTVSLVAIYVCQELLEGIFAAGHPAGLVGVFGYGGWWALPAAGCLGLVLAAAFHGARWVLHEVIRRHARPLGNRMRTPMARLRIEDLFLPTRAPLAGGWSGRGPPA